MSKYKGQHGGKKGQQIRPGVSPPLGRYIELLSFLMVYKGVENGPEWHKINTTVTLTTMQSMTQVKQYV